MIHNSENIFLRGFPEGFTLLTDIFAWVNMKIGISKCFYDGFDAFGQVLLNFAVPLIAWMALGLLIIISSKSSRVTHLIGNNAVKVLATIILVSYNTIIQTEISVFSCSLLYYPQNYIVTKYHWLADGNVLCWQGKHLVLVVIGVLFGVPTILYTLTLLFIQPLQRYSHVRGLRWVAKLKPFFDAYTSPHVIKPQYRFWTGLLLFFRLLSTGMVSYHSKNNEYKHYAVTLTIICIVILSLFSYFGGVYQQQWLNVLNAFYFTNLTILALWSFYYVTKYEESNRTGYEKQNKSTYISLSIAFTTFLLVLYYHIYKRLKNTRLFAYCVVRLQKTRCWRVVRQWKGRRAGYARVPQEDPHYSLQDREMDNDFDGERPVDEEVDWERELDEQLQT